MPPTEGVRWYGRPGTLAVVILVICLALNLWFG
jgi:hypothetical protein